MVPLDRAIRSFYVYAVNSNHISICSGLAAILNTKFLPAAIVNVRRITVSYPSVDCNVRYSSVIIWELQALWEIVFFLLPEVERWPSDIGGMVGPP